MKLLTFVIFCHAFCIAAAVSNSEGFDPNFVIPVQRYTNGRPELLFGFTNTYKDLLYYIYFNSEVLYRDPRALQYIQAETGQRNYESRDVHVAALNTDSQSVDRMYVLKLQRLKAIPKSPKDITTGLSYNPPSRRWYAVVQGSKIATGADRNRRPEDRAPSPMKQMLVFASAGDKLVDMITAVSKETYGTTPTGQRIYLRTETIVYQRRGLADAKVLQDVTQRGLHVHDGIGKYLDPI